MLEHKVTIHNKIHATIDKEQFSYDFFYMIIIADENLIKNVIFFKQTKIVITIILNIAN